MAVEILMPELGESVHEGTVSRWLKNVGDFVKEDEPVVEILTDKVNQELQAPASGVLAQILVKEGDSVQVFAPMGIIDEQAKPGDAVAPPAPVAPEVKAEIVAPAPVEPAPAPAPEGRVFLTPVVRRMAEENGIADGELNSITGTGEGGRITKKDIESYLSNRSAAPKVTAPEPTPAPMIAPKAAPTPVAAGPDQELTSLSGLRKMIAEAMVRSAAIPTVSTVTQCDVTTMVKYREINKEAFQEQHGVKLTYTPFFVKALAESLTEFPLVNSSLTPDNQVLRTNGVHIGVAVALGAKGDEGLIVPVIRDCHRKNLVEIARDLDEIAKKARANKLGLADVQGGTFTLTNPGTYGALFGTPMINAPQAAILGTYGISKQPVIVDDMIAIRSIMHLVLTYDHRLIDGMLAGKFLASVRDRLQTFDFFK
jgi:pyruvate/2-oxoglutarate dehydrogenase complex dihydrolipoamide acyltransferase (E2) component